MSAERKLPRGLRKSIRRCKAQIRKETGITRPQPDSFGWNNMEDLLRLNFPSYQKDYAPYQYILREFFRIRQEIRCGEPLENIKEFQAKHDPELLRELAPALTLITRTFSKRP